MKKETKVQITEAQCAMQNVSNHLKFTDIEDGKNYYAYVKPYNKVMRFRAEEMENAITGNVEFKLSNASMFFYINSKTFEGWIIRKNKFRCY